MISFPLSLTASENPNDGVKEAEEAKLGNLTLPSMQQPAPLFAFGQNLVDKGDLGAYLFIGTNQGINQHLNTVTPAVLWGISDKMSLFVTAPIASNSVVDTTSSSGFGDISAQFEFQLWGNYEENSSTVSGIVGLVFPTGNANASPSLGTGALGFIVGATANHISPDWYIYATQSAIINTTRNCYRRGSSYFYQFGVGRNMAYRTKTWVLTGFVEFNGTYIAQDKNMGVLDPNSGGSLIAVGPSVWFATQRLTLQAGILGIIQQELSGVQNCNRFEAIVGIGWKFH